MNAFSLLLSMCLCRSLFFNVLHVESTMMNDFSVGVGVDGGIGV